MNVESNSMLKKINYRDLMIFIVPILIFSLYLYIFNPGILTASSYSILHQIASGEFTNAHPIFYTFIVTICLKIYPSALTVGILQIIIFSIIWTVICKYHRDDSLTDSNQFVLQFVVTLIICLIPINAVNSITLHENVLFAYSLLLLAFLIKVLIDEEGRVNTALLVCIALTLAFTSQLSAYGIYIAILSLIMIAGYLFIKGNSKNTIAILTVATIVVVLLIASLNIVYNVSDSNENFIETHEIDLKKAKSDYFTSIKESPTESYEGATSLNYANNKYNMFNSIVNASHENILLDFLFNNPIVYFVLAIILLALIFINTNSKELFLIYVPSFLNMVIVFTTSKSQMGLYSNLLVCYLIIIILISILFRNNLNFTRPPQEESHVESHQENAYDVSEKESHIETPNEDIIIEEEYVEIPQDDTYDSFNGDIEEITLEEIEEMPDTPNFEDPTENEDHSELVDEILKEIEMENKNK